MFARWPPHGTFAALEFRPRVSSSFRRVAVRNAIPNGRVGDWLSVSSRWSTPRLAGMLLAGRSLTSSFRIATDAGDFQGGDESTVGFTGRGTTAPIHEGNGERLLHFGIALCGSACPKAVSSRSISSRAIRCWISATRPRLPSCPPFEFRPGFNSLSTFKPPGPSANPQSDRSSFGAAFGAEAPRRTYISLVIDCSACYHLGDGNLV